MCEWMSMRPGVTQRPFASTMRAPSGAASALPIAWILPPTISTSPSSMRVPVPVSTVAPRINVGGLGAGEEVEEKGARLAAAGSAAFAVAADFSGACGCAAHAAERAAAAARHSALEGLIGAFYSFGRVAVQSRHRNHDSRTAHIPGDRRRHAGALHQREDPHRRRGDADAACAGGDRDTDTERGALRLL